MRDQEQKKKIHTVLLVEDEVLVRMPIAAYLLECGYRVIEAADAEEAILVLTSADLGVDIVFTAAELDGKQMDGFALSQWVRRHRPDTRVVLAGTPKRAVSAAGELCEEGPMLRRPYTSATIEGLLRSLLATKPDTQGSD